MRRLWPLSPQRAAQTENQGLEAHGPGRPQVGISSFHLLSFPAVPRLTICPCGRTFFVVLWNQLPVILNWESSCPFEVTALFCSFPVCASQRFTAFACFSMRGALVSLVSLTPTPVSTGMRSLASLFFSLVKSIDDQITLKVCSFSTFSSAFTGGSIKTR